MPKGCHQNHARASKQHRWKPGGSVASNGYVKIRVGIDHPLADPNGYAYEHYVVWCSAGRQRPSGGEVLHHINEDKTDNRIGNLELMRRGAHNSSHIIVGDRRDPETGRLRKRRAGRLLDGVEHNEFSR